MRRSIDDATDDHPADDDERPPVSWAVALSDDCDACGMREPRVVLTMEQVGRAGLGLLAHLAPDTARRMRAAIATALREIGEDPGPSGDGMTSDAGSSQPVSRLQPGQAAAIWGVVAAGWAVFLLPLFFGPVGMALGSYAWWRGERRGRW